MKSLAIMAIGVVAAFSSLVRAAPANTWQVYEGWPFDANEASRRQTETAAALKQPVELKIPVERDGPTIDLRLIPAGKFIMGSPKTEDGHEGDETLHPETIADPFYMMETQLTVEQYRALLHTNPPGMPVDADPKLPAALAYRDFVDQVLPALAKLAPVGWKVILPDRARLEYAARAGVATMSPGGDKPEDAAAYAWTHETSGNKAHPVAQKKPNAWGLYDVIGNHWHFYWLATGAYGDTSRKYHIVYGGSYADRVGDNGARLANINVSDRAEGARFALIRAETAAPKGHPETLQAKP